MSTERRGGNMRLGFMMLAVTWLASGCAASKFNDAATQVRPKNPHAAIEYLAQALKADPKNEESLAMLKEIVQNLAEDHATRVKELERSGKFADAVAQCDRLIATKKLVSELPG